MSFDIFDRKYLDTLLNPFMPIVTNALVPIRYEALTPDLFAFLFCLTDTSDVEHFFVSLEFDHINGIDGARCTIESWHGEVLAFVPLLGTTNPNESEIESYKAETTGPYYAVLTEVGKPLGVGYWSSKVVIMPGDSIDEKIAHYTKEQQEKIKKAIVEKLQHKPSSEKSFLESFNSKFKDTIVDGVNVTDMIVTIYVQKNGSCELFTNFKR